MPDRHSERMRKSTAALNIEHARFAGRTSKPLRGFSAAHAERFSMPWKNFLRVIGTFGCALVIGGCGTTRSFITVNPEPKNHVWWLRSELRPFGSTLRGIPVQEVHRDWCKANEFSLDLFPPEIRFGGDFPLDKALEESGARFAVSGKFDGTRVFDVFVGVYETCSAETGTFWVAMEKTAPSRVGRVFVEQFPGSARFAVLHASDERGFALWWCFACDELLRFRWNKSAARFEVERAAEGGEKTAPDTRLRPIRGEDAARGGRGTR